MPGDFRWDAQQDVELSLRYEHGIDLPTLVSGGGSQGPLAQGGRRGYLKARATSVSGPY
jgi:hypothetical protein